MKDKEFPPRDKLKQGDKEIMDKETYKRNKRAWAKLNGIELGMGREPEGRKPRNRPCTARCSQGRAARAESVQRAGSMTMSEC